MDLTKKAQFGKKCSDGKHRNYMLYFLNGQFLHKVRIPYEEGIDKGWDRITTFSDEIYKDGRIWITKTKYGRSRRVSYPVPQKSIHMSKKEERE